MKTASGRASLKWYRTNLDQFALKRLEQELHKTYQVPENKKILDFERKTKENKTIQTGLSVLSPVKLTLIKTKTQFFLSDQIVVIFRHGLVISFSGNELIREVHYSSTNLFL